MGLGLAVVQLAKGAETKHAANFEEQSISFGLGAYDACGINRPF